MATKNTALRNAIANAFGDNFNTGTLKIYTAANATLLATFTLDADAFGAASTGVCTLLGVPMSVTAAGTGIAATADLESTGSTYTLLALTVGEAATQVIIDNADINSGQTVTLNSFTWTEGASA